MPTLDQITERVRAAVGADSGVDARIKFLFGQDGILLIDGRSRPNQVLNTDGDSDITITGAALLGDMNCDVTLDAGDIEPFTTALLDAGAFTECNLNAADVNADTLIDGADIAAFTEALLAP